MISKFHLVMSTMNAYAAQFLNRVYNMSITHQAYLLTNLFEGTHALLMNEPKSVIFKG